MIKFNSSGN